MLRLRRASFALPRLPLLPVLPLLAGLAFAPTAHGQSDGDRETAEVLFKQANEARAGGDIPGAAAKYKVAYALVQTPLIGLAFGKAQMDGGLLVEARQTFLSVGRIAVLPNESARAAAARSEATALAGQLAPRIATVSLKLHTRAGSPSPAVSIDGVAIPEVAFEAPRRLNPGNHVVEVTLAGAKASTAFHVGVGETKDVGVEVPAPLSAGDVGGVPWAAPVVVVPSPVSAPAPAPGATTRHSRLPAYIALGAGGAGVVVTAVFGALALGSKSSLNGDCSAGRTSCPTSAQGDINALSSNALVSDIGLGVAVVGLGVGGVLLWMSHGDSAESGPKPSAARVTPWVGLGSAGLRGSF